jgi:hypothetical protein
MLAYSHGKKRPTQRALDAGESARFLGIFLAMAEFRFDSESTLHPSAGNASRRAAESDEESGLRVGALFFS